MELVPDGTGTRLTYTAQDGFLDGEDQAAKRGSGCRMLLESGLGAELHRLPAQAGAGARR